MNQALEVLDFDMPIPTPLPYTEDKDEFFARRLGKITASRISDVMAGGNGDTRKKYMYQLAIERITGKPIRGGFKNYATEHGNAFEDEALDIYQLLFDMNVEKVGFVSHPSIANAGCSPDAFSGDDGMVQIKAPNQDTHIGYALSKQVPRPYFLQIQWEMACCNKAWSDFVTYDPDQIPRLKLFAIRLHREDGEIKVLEQAVIQFDKEVEDLCEKLRKI